MDTRPRRTRPRPARTTTARLRDDPDIGVVLLTVQSASTEPDGRLPAAAA